MRLAHFTLSIRLEARCDVSSTFISFQIVAIYHQIILGADKSDYPSPIQPLVPMPLYSLAGLLPERNHACAPEM
jgi:hypothetical protein